MKKAIALILTFVLILGLVGCGGQKRKIVKLTLSTEDSEAILRAAGIMLPDAESTAASGTKIKWFSWFDPFHNYSEDEIVSTGYWTFCEKYGCDIEYIACTWQTRFDELGNLILSGNAPDFYPGDTSKTACDNFPAPVLKGVFKPVDTYIDYDDPLWADMKDYVYTYFSLKGRPYVIGTDYAFGNVVGYNRRVMDEYGFDDPATLYYNDEWTWDKFADMCYTFSDPDEDRYALDGWYFHYALMHSSGESVARYNPETMKFESNIDSPALERAASLLYDLSKNDTIFPWWNNGWAVRGGEGSGIKEGKCLFWVVSDWGFTGPAADIGAVWGDVGTELMFCPLPRDTRGDGEYYIDSCVKGYCIVNGAENPEGVALLAACERFKVLDPTVINFDRRQKEEIYHWTDEMLKMWDTCYSIASSGNVVVSYDKGFGDDVKVVVDVFEENGHKQNAQTWGQLKENYGDMLDAKLGELNKRLDEFEPDD